MATHWIFNDLQAFVKDIMSSPSWSYERVLLGCFDQYNRVEEPWKSSTARPLQKLALTSYCKISSHFNSCVNTTNNRGLTSHEDLWWLSPSSST